MGSLPAKQHAVVAYPLILFMVHNMEEPLLYVGLAVLFLTWLVTYRPERQMRWRIWYQHHTRWVHNDYLFVATVLGEVACLGALFGATSGDILRGIAFGLVWGTVILGAHFLCHGGWRKILGATHPRP